MACAVFLQRDRKEIRVQNRSDDIGEIGKRAGNSQTYIWAHGLVDWSPPDIVF